MAIKQNHAWSGDESKRLCDLVFEALPRAFVRKREDSSYCKGTTLSQKSAWFWIKHTKHTITFYPVCEDTREITVTVRELLPSGVTLRVRPFPRKAIDISTPLFFKIETEAQAKGMGPLLQFLIALRPDSSLRAGFGKSELWHPPSETGDAENTSEEGNRVSVLVNRYERDPKNRKRCILHYGAVCQVCDFIFSNIYGEIGDGYIHVHHLNALAASGGKAKAANPIKDLRPVCPNCHEMLHRGDPLRPKTIEQLKEIIAKVKYASHRLNAPDSEG